MEKSLRNDIVVVAHPQGQTQRFTAFHEQIHPMRDRDPTNLNKLCFGEDRFDLRGGGENGACLPPPAY